MSKITNQNLEIQLAIIKLLEDKAFFEAKEILASVKNRLKGGKIRSEDFVEKTV